MKKLVDHDSEGGNKPCSVDRADDAAPTFGEGVSSRASNKEPPIATLCSERKEARRSIANKLCDLLGEMVTITNAMYAVVEKCTRFCDG